VVGALGSDDAILLYGVVFGVAVGVGDIDTLEPCIVGDNREQGVVVGGLGWPAEAGGGVVLGLGAAV